MPKHAIVTNFFAILVITAVVTLLVQLFNQVEDTIGKCLEDRTACSSTTNNHE